MSDERAPVLRMKVHGMDCAEEVSALRSTLGPLVPDPERDLGFDIVTGTLTVRVPLDEARVLQAVSAAGLRAERLAASRDATLAEFSAPPAWRILRGPALSGACTLAGFAVHAWLAGGIVPALGSEGAGGAHAVPWVARAIYAAGIALALRRVVPRAWAAVKARRADMNALMTIAVIGAIAIGEWFEAATVSFLFALSLALESWSVGRARRAVAALLDLSPARALMLGPDGQAREVGVAEVPAGARLVLRPGDRIPLDGTVSSGTGYVNQAPITGESRPVSKSPGDPVYAGTLNQDGALEIVVTKTAEDTTLAHIVRQVREAQANRARAEQWVERFARRYTPAVLLIAIAVFLVPTAFAPAAWNDWLYRALVLLVIACPCALVISTPVTVVAGLTAAARRGILVKGGIHLETAARLDAIGFDKTGTLTTGYPVVHSVAAFDGATGREVLEIAAALERMSRHPAGRAILEHAERNGVAMLPAERVEAVPGRGIRGVVRGADAWAGSARFAEETAPIPPDVRAAFDAVAADGRTLVCVGTGKRIIGVIGLGDTPRPHAAESLARLRRLGIRHLALLSGDHPATAAHLARSLGIDTVRAGLLPADKVTAVEGLLRDFGAVAMVGDGVNDAPALARASLGISMGGAGSDAAIESSDVTLMSDALERLPWLVAHAKRTLRTIRVNIAFALAVKLVVVALAAMDRATLAAAIVADTGASLLVVFNGMRLLGAGRRPSSPS